MVWLVVKFGDKIFGVNYISIIYIDPAQRKVIEEYNLETTEKNMTIFKEV